MPICPECESYLESLNYSCSTSGWEDGTIEASGSGYINWEYSDSATEDSRDFILSCPDCNNELFHDLMEAEEWLKSGIVEEENKKKEEEQIHKHEFEF